eukprot:12674613-Alexandrium_andersonii.AAC.1
MEQPRRPRRTSPTRSSGATARSTGSSAWGPCSPATARSSSERSWGFWGRAPRTLRWMTPRWSTGSATSPL